MNPIIRFMNPDLQLALMTDASLRAVAAILFQPRYAGELPSFENIIGFYSKTLDSMQQRWHSYKRECYAVYLGIKHFHEFLAFTEFDLFVDAKALVQLMINDPIHHTTGFWVSELYMYRFKVWHIPGIENQPADFLSRPINMQQLRVAKKMVCYAEYFVS